LAALRSIFFYDKVDEDHKNILQGYISQLQSRNVVVAPSDYTSVADLQAFQLHRIQSEYDVLFFLVSPQLCKNRIMASEELSQVKQAYECGKLLVLPLLLEPYQSGTYPFRGIPHFPGDTTPLLDHLQGTINRDLARNMLLPLRESCQQHKDQRDRHDQLWEKSIQSDTISGYSAYLEAFPSGNFTKEANGRIDSLREEELWNLTKANSGDVAALLEYMRFAPLGKRRLRVAAKLYEIETSEENIWKEARNSEAVVHQLAYNRSTDPGKFRENSDAFISTQVRKYRGIPNLNPSLLRVNQLNHQILSSGDHSRQHSLFHLVQYYDKLQERTNAARDRIRESRSNGLLIIAIYGIFVLFSTGLDLSFNFGRDGGPFAEASLTRPFRIPERRVGWVIFALEVYIALRFLLAFLVSMLEERQLDRAHGRLRHLYVLGRIGLLQNDQRETAMAMGWLHSYEKRLMNIRRHNFLYYWMHPLAFAKPVFNRRTLERQFNRSYKSRSQPIAT